MRLIVVTGKGGVGVTTLAGATAVHAARSGHKTALVSTSPGCSLAAVLGVDPAADEAVEVEPSLFLPQVDAHSVLERSWPAVAGLLGGSWPRASADPLAPDEVTVLPGVDELVTLLALRDLLRSGRWDVMVVDAGPAAAALRLLGLPETLGRLARRLLPGSAGLARVLVPLHEQMTDVQAALIGPQVSVRLVMSAERVAVAETRRTLTAVALLGQRVDAVVVNRVLSAEGADPWRAGWARAHAAVLAEVQTALAPVPVLRAGFRDREPMGVEDLGALAAEVYAGCDALAEPTGEAPMVVDRVDDGFVLSLALPFVTRSGMRLARRGDDLVVTVDGQRRVLTLPSVLRRCDVTGARLSAGRLRIRFQPDPARWRSL